MATNLTEQSFETVLKQPGIVLIDFWAPWCGPCRTFGPIFEAASKKHTDIHFYKLDTEAEPGIASALQIQSIPTLMVLRDGILLYRQAGALPAKALEQLIQSIRDVDMADVRAKLARSQSKSKSASAS